MRAIDRLIQYIDYKSFTNASFEKAVGLSNGYIRKLRSGKGSIGSEMLEKIALQFIDLSLFWLITGNGTMIEGEKVAKSSQNGTGNTLLAQELLADYKQILQEQRGVIASMQKILDEQREIIDDLKGQYPRGPIMFTRSLKKGARV